MHIKGVRKFFVLSSTNETFRWEREGIRGKGMRKGGVSERQTQVPSRSTHAHELLFPLPCPLSSLPRSHLLGPKVGWIDEKRAPFTKEDFTGRKRPAGWLYQQVRPWWLFREGACLTGERAGESEG